MDISQKKSSAKNKMYEHAHTAVNYLMSRTDFRPTLGLVLGTGLSGIADLVQDRQEFSYKEIPNFKSSTAPGHKGRLVLGYLGGSQVMCMNGRLHLYEGYTAQECTMSIYMMHLMGAQKVIVTNAAGGLNQEYSEGDFMILKDHINLPGLSGKNPLLGPNEDRFGPRFLALSDAYDRPMRELAWKVAQDLGLIEYFHEGVYIQQTGPCYETVAESRMMRLLGADVVGMSTLPEAIAARHCGMKVFAMSLVTNMVVLDYDVDEVANEEEVLLVGEQRSADLQKFMMRFVSELSTVIDE